MMNQAGFANVIHENGDVRRGRTLNRPQWTAREDEVLYNTVHHRLSDGIDLDADQIFDEIIGTYPTWQRSVLAIKTQIPVHASRIRTEMLRLADSEKRNVRRESDQALLLLEQHYLAALNAASDANIALKAEYAKIIIELTDAMEDVERQNQQYVRELADAHEDAFDAGRQAQDLHAENIRLQERNQKMKILARLMTNESSLDNINVDVLTHAASALTITDHEDPPPIPSSARIGQWNGGPEDLNPNNAPSIASTTVERK
jgi:hypothetical protein